MSTKANPGSFDCFAKADPDEPMFVLLGRDAAAMFAVLFWAQLRVLMYGVSDQITEAQATSEAMRDWAMKLGKTDAIKLGYDAFRTACVTVAKTEIETDAKELVRLLSEMTPVTNVDRAIVLAKKLAGV